MINVLQVLYTLGKSDGSANVIMNIYRHINHSSIQFDFLYFQDAENSFIDEIKGMGGSIYKVSLESFKDYINFSRNINIIFKNNWGRFQAVHVNFPLLGYFIFHTAKKYNINNLILHSHSSSYGTSFIKKIRNFTFYRLARYESRIYLTCSKQAGIFLFGKKNWNQGKVHIINNAIDCSKYDYNEIIRKTYRKELGISDEYVIGHVGRFSREKNHKYILKIFNELKKQYPKTKLVLIGDGPEMKDVSIMVKEYNLCHDVLILGVRNDIDKLLQAIDIFLMPSLYEGLPVTLVEAQAAGLPCVVSDNVPNDSCIISEIYASISLKDDISTWIQNIMRYYNFSRQSTYDLMKNKRFDIMEISKELELLYKSL